MRTAVVRIGVDPAGELTAAQLTDGVAALREAGAEVVENNLAALPVTRREVEVLLAGDDAGELTDRAMAMCAKAFGTSPVPGVLTFISRGTDDDALGVLAGFGITGEIVRTAGDDGWDIVEVTLNRSDLERIPESRIHTALEASLNCEVRIALR
jgi:CBS domain-containing protein